MPWPAKFLQHLATDRGASVYTQRNYRQAIEEFCQWHNDERRQPPAWEVYRLKSSPAEFVGIV